MTDIMKLLGDFPEINPANYGDDEVNALNAWGIAAHTAIEALQAENASLLQQAQIWKQEATAQRATVHEAYRVCTGNTGEPGDWNGAEPIRKLAAEREQLQAENERLAQDRDEWRDSTIAANQNAASEARRREDMQEQRDTWQRTATELQAKLDSAPKAPARNTDYAQAAIALNDAWLHHTGAEPSVSVLGRAIDQAAELLLQVGRVNVQGEAVYLVATGETHNGEETYTRHDVIPPLCEAEKLYSHPQATEPAGYKLVPVEPTPEMLDAALNEVLRIASELDDEASHSEIYQAMLAAAPEVP